jgi:hypothetical protein
MTRDAIFDSVCTGLNRTCTCSLCDPEGTRETPSLDPRAYYGEPPPPPAAPSFVHRRSLGLAFEVDYDFSGFADGDD